MLMTVAEFAKKRGVSIVTVYSWIYRGKLKDNKFALKQIGKIKLIKDLDK
jgi:predicted site-specific integrase-resolvase